MNLFHIKQDTCYFCGSRTVRETQRNQHTNGEWNETREYECGSIVIYSPNFRQQKVSMLCPNHPEKLAERKRRKKILKSINKLVDESNVDIEFKNQIRMYLPKI
jgi:hypothetical protein